MNLKLYLTNYIKLFYAAIIAAAVFFYVERREIVNVEQILFILFGGINRYENTFFLDWIIFILPLCIYIFMFGSFIGDDINRSAVFLFIRKNNKLEWYTKKILSLFLFTVIYYLIFIITITTCFMIKGIPIHSVESYFYCVFIIFICCILCNFVFLTATNILSIKIKNTAIPMSLICIAYYPVQILLTPPPYASRPMIKFYPSMQSALFLHQITDTPFINSQYFELSISGFSVMFSLIYNLIFFTLLYLIGIIMIKKHEFL